MTDGTGDDENEKCEKVGASDFNVLLCDFCLLCGDKVKPALWRDHMIGRHSVVLSESPMNKNGLWKDIETNSFVRITKENQCDGCNRGLPVIDFLHRDSAGKPFMVCTKTLYT